MHTKTFIDSLFYKAIVLDNNLIVTEVNQKMKDVLKSDYQENLKLTGENYIEIAEKSNFLNDEQISIMESNLKKILNNETESFSKEFSFNNNAIEDIPGWFKMNATPFKNGILILFEDISKEKKLEKQLRIKEQQYQTIFEKAPIGIILKGRNGRVLEVNEEASKISGYDKKDLKNNNIFGTLVHENDYEKVKTVMERVLQGEDIRTNVEAKDANNNFYYMHVSETSIDVPEYGKGILSMQIDLRNLLEKENEIDYLKTHDNLTGLYNKKYLENYFIKSKKRNVLPLSVIYVDINGLKIINNTYDFKVGDKAIKKTAHLLDSMTRKEDVLVRMGGDEFALILPTTSKEDSEIIVSRIREQENILSIKNTSLSLAIGFTTINEKNKDISHILNKAEKNMNNDKLNNAKSYKYKLVNNLLKTLEVKSNETTAHVMRVEKLSKEFGKYLKLDYQQIQHIAMLAKLHDVGKISISEEILKKPGKLTEEEWEIMKKHARRGYEITNSTSEFSPISKYILHHHERWDGTGYPEGLSGKDIPLLSRIITIIDAYDVMVNERPYTKPISINEALSELKECSGTQFDPELVSQFSKMIREKNNN